MSKQVIVIELEDVRNLVSIANSISSIFDKEDRVKIHVAINNVADNILSLLQEPNQSNLVDHTRKELELTGQEPEYIEQVVKVVQAFADMGHSGSSAYYTLHILHDLFQFKNLSALTDDPHEWQKIDEDVWGKPGGIWQNRRNSEAFSNDGGKTYYLLSEGANDMKREPLHETVKKIE